MAKSKRHLLHFPLGGIDKRSAYVDRPPYTTPVAVNVRPMDAYEGRARGGSRPMLQKAYTTQLGGGAPIKMLNSVTAVRNDGYRYFVDLFDEMTLSDQWEQASWIGASPKVLPGSLSLEEVLEGGLVLKTRSDLDSSKRYSVGLYLAPWDDYFHGEYRIHARMDDSVGGTPDPTDEGITATLLMEDNVGSFSGTLKRYSGNSEVGSTDFTVTASPLGASEAGWFLLQVSGDQITCWWRGNQLCSVDITGELTVYNGHRVGFSMKASDADAFGDHRVCLLHLFQFNYYSTESFEEYRKSLVAVSNGKLYIEDSVNRELQEADVNNPSLASDRTLQSAEWGQKLFIADHGEAKVSNTDGNGSVSGTDLTDAGVPDFTAIDPAIDTSADVCFIYDGDATVTTGSYNIVSVEVGKVVLDRDAGTGGCSYRIERGPKVFDPKTNTLSIWETESRDGGVKKLWIPPGCSLICRYHDALMLAGDRLDPHQWYMMRVGNPYDADYLADPDDPQKAVFGSNSEAGKVGEPITCLAPYKDDYVIMGGTNSLWLMRGHPAYNGAIDNLSDIAGVVSATSWCYGPEGELVFLSRDGIYIMGPGIDAMPIRFSREKMPRDLLNVDPQQNIVTMAYDVRDYGVHLFITPKDAGGNEYQTHYWLDWNNKSFYQVTTVDNYEPFSLYRYISDRLDESHVLVGGRDGYIRYFSNLVDREDGAGMDSEVWLGPVPMGRSLNEEGILEQVYVVMDNQSRTVVLSVHTGDSFEDCIQSDSRYSVVMAKGTNYIFRPHLRGVCFALKFTGVSRWAMEKVQVQYKPAGVLR